MKTTLAFILLFTASLSFGKDFLKKGQKDIILKEIDLICGDTWCSGDYNFNFKSIQCDDTKAVCQINYEMFIWEHDEAKLSLNCLIRPVKKFSDMVKKSGTYFSIQETFYEKISSCLEINIIKYGPELI